ncbi:hypothetical protein CALCODRAFT_276140 [Calocera cornea HHB12733]|uniref:Uncharacterized protein n=1 Tax=Calocera cornea HHB12733 TaxID=1353952 RepID=A0A165G3A7_9BASI|nr:hypothetical protein CALCODRAFT_276140 [Calocera cornea HHB12733]
MTTSHNGSSLLAAKITHSLNQRHTLPSTLPSQQQSQPSIHPHTALHKQTAGRSPVAPSHHTQRAAATTTGVERSEAGRSPSPRRRANRSVATPHPSPPSHPSSNPICTLVESGQGTSRASRSYMLCAPCLVSVTTVTTHHTPHHTASRRVATLGTVPTPRSARFVSFRFVASHSRRHALPLARSHALHPRPCFPAAQTRLTRPNQSERTPGSPTAPGLLFQEASPPINRAIASGFWLLFDRARAHAREWLCRWGLHIDRRACRAQQQQ